MKDMKENFKNGISDFGIKYLAMICMILDHIEYFFGFTGKIPIWFSWVGRLAAPLFLFCIIEGFVHTHNRKLYFIRMYLIAIGMGLIQFSFHDLGRGLVRPDGFYPQNQMLSSFILILVVLQGFDWWSQKKWLRGLLAVIVPILFPIMMVPVFRIPDINFAVNILAYTLFPIHTAIIDGGTWTLVLGIVLYLTRKNRKVQAVAFILYVILIDIGFVILISPSFNASMLLTEAYQWMEIFAVIPMLCYNGTRGNGSKKLFYWFYPLHVYILFGMSWLLYVLIK